MSSDTTPNPYPQIRIRRDRIMTSVISNGGLLPTGFQDQYAGGQQPKTARESSSVNFRRRHRRLGEHMAGNREDRDHQAQTVSADSNHTCTHVVLQKQSI